MKELSFFLLKNTFGAKMRKGFRSFCTDDCSTSTLNQQSSCQDQGRLDGLDQDRQPTLEEMLFRLDMEEEMAMARARSKLDERGGPIRHRMSCVNSSDILRTARNALSQYPRFSLDGKDSMYRSSFRTTEDRGWDRGGCLPSRVGGERVVWCKPGIVAKLMGLEAVPVPLRRSRHDMEHKIRRQNLRRRAEMEIRHERRDAELMMMMMKSNNNGSSCSTANGFCVANEGEVGWPIRGGVLYRNHNLV